MHKQKEIQSKEKNEEEEEEIARLRKRVKELEAQFLRAEIKAEAYDEMINIAEKMFNIPIRRKLDDEK